MRNSLISSIANHFGRTYSGFFVFQFVISAHLTGCPVCILPEGPGQLALHVPRHHLRRCSPPPPLRRRPLPLPTPSPTPFPNPLPQPPFTGIVLCHLAVRRCWAARAPRRRRCGASAGRSGRTGPWECGMDTHCAESPCFIQSTESGAETGAVGRMQSHGAAAGTQSEFAGSRRDILQDILEDILQEMIQDILRGYPTGCTHHPHRISYRISC